MLYVAKLHAYAVLHVCECKDKARQSKNKRFQFLWQYVAGVCRLQRQKQQEKLARNQLHGCTQYTYFAPDNRSMVQTVTTILTNKTA